MVPGHAFPTQTDPPIARVAAHARRRAVADRDVLVEVADTSFPFFVLLRGELQVVRPLPDGREELIVTHAPAGTLRVREFLTRNGHPHQYVDLDRDPQAQELIDQFHVSVDDVPVLVCRGTTLHCSSDDSFAES